MAGMLVPLSLALATAAATGAEDRRFLGFAVEVNGDGFFLNPTLKSATISSIVAPSRAASASIAPKDSICPLGDIKFRRRPMPHLDPVFLSLRAIMAPYAEKLDAGKNDESELCLYAR